MSPQEGICFANAGSDRDEPSREHRRPNNTIDLAARVQNVIRGAKRSHKHVSGCARPAVGDREKEESRLAEIERAARWQLRAAGTHRRPWCSRLKPVRSSEYSATVQQVSEGTRCRVDIAGHGTVGHSILLHGRVAWREQPVLLRHRPQHSPRSLLESRWPAPRATSTKSPRRPATSNSENQETLATSRESRLQRTSAFHYKGGLLSTSNRNL